MTVWEVRCDYAFNEVESAIDTMLYESFDSAKTVFDEIVHDEIEQYYADYIESGHAIDGYELERDAFSFRFWEDGNYCGNHAEITLNEKEVLP